MHNCIYLSSLVMIKPSQVYSNFTKNVNLTMSSNFCHLTEVTHEVLQFFKLKVTILPTTLENFDQLIQILILLVSRTACRTACRTASRPFHHASPRVPFLLYLAVVVASYLSIYWSGFKKKKMQRRRKHKLQNVLFDDMMK